MYTIEIVLTVSYLKRVRRIGDKREPPPSPPEFVRPANSMIRMLPVISLVVKGKISL